MQTIPKDAGEFRSDIEGLRGIAVLSILIFHLEPIYLPGGFVGVDIFFVISGYLISRIIFSAIGSGSFSLSEFYVRRARRILPALFATLLASIAAAPAFLYPGELAAFVRSTISSALFVANFYFHSSLGYFSPRAEDTPLLHLWSLGVEEQFYLLFPACCIALSRLGNRALAMMVLGGIVLSISAAAWVVSFAPATAFYMLPFRAYELLIGSAIALPGLRPIGHRGLARILSLLGILLIAAALLAFNKQTPVPGLPALLPCAGAALIVYAGKGQSMFMAPWVANRLFLFVGGRSYTLYLIHWPVIVFGARMLADTNPSLRLAVMLFASFLLAEIVHRLVEQPARRAAIVQRPIHAAAMTGVGAAAIVLAATLIDQPRRGAAAEGRIERITSYLNHDPKKLWHSGRCFLEEQHDPSRIDFGPCLPAAGKRSVVIWGDSFGAQYYPGLAKVLEGKGFAVGLLSAAQCPPAPGNPIRRQPICNSFNSIAFDLLKASRPDVVVLSSNWALDGRPELFLVAINRTIDQLQELGIKVVVLGDNLIYRIPVPLLIAERLASGKDALNGERQLLWREVMEEVHKGQLAHLLRQKHGVTYISVLGTVCPDYRCPLLAADDIPVHTDQTHLSEAGSQYFARLLVPAIVGK